MKMFKKTILIIIASMCFTGMAQAQLTATWSSPSVTVGTVTSVDFTVDLSGVDLADTVSIGFISSFDAAMTFTSCTISGSPNFLDACQINGGGDISVGLISAIPANPIVTITFDITGVGVGTYNVQLAAASSPQYVLGATSPATNVLTVATGTLTVNAGPTPTYGSTPAPGTPLTVMNVLQGSGTDPTTAVVINNDAGDADTVLSGTCALTTGAPFSFVGGSEGFSVAQNAAGTGTLTDTVTVACDNAAMTGNYTDTLTCPSNGGANATYALECNVNPPQPAYTSNPAAGMAINLGTAVAGTGTIAATNLQISNTGDAGTTLNATCTVADNVNFSVGANLSGATIAAGANVSDSLTCNDPGAAGFAPFSTTLTCTNNDPVIAADVTYALTCEYTEPGVATYVSSPVAGAVNMTPSGDVLQGSTAPTLDLVITNGTNDGTANDLDLVACSMTAGTITAAPASLTASIAPDGGTSNQTVTFTCPTTNVGAQTGTYTCPYSTNGVAGIEGTAVYNVTCGVRAPASAGTPANGAALTTSITAPPGGNSPSTTVVIVEETLGEGAVISNLTCSLDAGAAALGFVLDTAVAGVSVASGANLPIDVTFTDLGVAGPYTATLSCTYDDTLNGANQAFSVVITGAIQALVIPALSTIGYVAMMFGLLLVGFFGFRRRA